MRLSNTLVAALVAALLLPALPDAARADSTITIHDAYVRSATPMARSGAAFMVIENTADSDDRLIAAASEVAERVELHSHEEDAAGVMRMFEVEGGFVIPAGGRHALARGGDHVMLMGLTRTMAQGETVTLTLLFEHAGQIEIEVVVDHEREDGHNAGHGHD